MVLDMSSQSKLHSDEFITEVFELSRKEGLTAREIAEAMSPKYNTNNCGKMTRNSVISILNRYKGRFTHMGKTEVKRIDFADVAERLELERERLKDKDKYKVKKCLCCRKERLLHRVSFVCDTCKTSAAYTSSVADYSVRY